jgi:hypothetical protein
LTNSKPSGGRDGELSPWRKLVNPGVRREELGSQSDPGIAGQVGLVGLVVADVFQEIGVRDQQPLRLDRERPGERFRIVDRDFEIPMTEVTAPLTFRDAKGLGLWMSRIVGCDRRRSSYRLGDAIPDFGSQSTSANTSCSRNCSR